MVQQLLSQEEQGCVFMLPLCLLLVQLGTLENGNV